MPNEATLALAPLLSAEAEGEAAAFEVVEVGAREEVEVDEAAAEDEAADEGEAAAEAEAEAELSEAAEEEASADEDSAAASEVDSEGAAASDEDSGAASEEVSGAGASEEEPSAAEDEAEPSPSRHERSVPWMETGAEKAERPVLSRTFRVTWVPASMSMFQVYWWSLVPCERYLRAAAPCWPPGMTETM